MSIGVKAGEINQPVKIMKATLAQDAEGQEVYTYAQEAEIYAKVTPMKAGEKYASGREMANTYCRFLIRHFPGLTRKIHYINWRNNNYDIINIEEDGRMNLEYMIVLCEILETA